MSEETVENKEDGLTLQAISPKCRENMQMIIKFFQQHPDVFQVLQRGFIKPPPNVHGEKIDFKLPAQLAWMCVRMYWKTFRKSPYHIDWTQAKAFCHQDKAVCWPKRVAAYCGTWLSLNNFSTTVGDVLHLCGINGLKSAFRSVLWAIKKLPKIKDDNGQSVRTLMDFFKLSSAELDLRQFDAQAGGVVPTNTVDVLTVFIALSSADAEVISNAYKVIYECATAKQRKWIESTFPIHAILGELQDVGGRFCQAFIKYCAAMIDHHERANDKEGVEKWAFALQPLNELESLVGIGEEAKVRVLAGDFVSRANAAGAYTYATLHTREHEVDDLWSELVRGERVLWFRFSPDGTEFWNETFASVACSQMDPEHYYDVPQSSGLVRDVLAFYFNDFKKHCHPERGKNGEWIITQEIAAQVPFKAYGDAKTWNTFNTLLDRLPGLKSIFENELLEPANKAKDKKGRTQNKGRKYCILPYPHQTDIPKRWTFGEDAG